MRAGGVTCAYPIASAMAAFFLVTPKGHRRFSAATRRMADRGSKPSESANSLPARTEKRSFAPGAGVRALAYRPRFPRQPKASAGSPLVWQTFTRWCFCFRRRTTLGGVGVVIAEDDPG